LARDSALSDPDATELIVAHGQTAGKGRLGRQFLSPKGSGIYMTLRLPLKDALSSAIGVTCAASVAVMRAIRRTTGLQTQIKWVNDLLLNEKKVCGILTETITVEAQTVLIIGIGINLRPVQFPPELADIAGSLNQIHLPRKALISAILEELLPLLEHPQDRGWLSDYRQSSCVLNRPLYRIRGEDSIPCQGTKITEDGGLTVLYEDGTVETLRTGEVSIRLR
jgi:BirA family biotin operon repressor/biotin-[acetyl-CoA-carboxylase] ligase